MSDVVNLEINSDGLWPSRSIFDINAARAALYSEGFGMAKFYLVGPEWIIDSLRENIPAALPEKFSYHSFIMSNKLLNDIELAEPEDSKEAVVYAMSSRIVDFPKIEFRGGYVVINGIELEEEEDQNAC